tara:strand:- start:2336 stop:2578 length:243 start_codon:yes stop_codon:yes gene_type:complete
VGVAAGGIALASYGAYKALEKLYGFTPLPVLKGEASFLKSLIDLSKGKADSEDTSIILDRQKRWAEAGGNPLRFLFGIGR